MFLPHFISMVSTFEYEESQFEETATAMFQFSEKKLKQKVLKLGCAVSIRIGFTEEGTE